MILFSCAAVAPLLASAFPEASVCTLPPDRRLAAPVSTHADMLVFTYGDTAIMEEVYAKAHDLQGKYRLITAKVPRGERYPDDIGLNALAVGDRVFCNAAHTAREILGCGREIVDVRQGYAACSALVLSDSCIVTADPSIARAAERKNVDIVQIRPGYIRLPGYDSGFIGGATARVGEAVCFFGDPSVHPDFPGIEAACSRLGLRICVLGDGVLADHGGVRVLE